MTADRMTPRARAYLVVCSVQSTILALVCWFIQHQFTSTSFAGIKAVAPISVWGGLFAFTALLSLYAAARGSEQSARWALLTSVIVSGAWVGGFLAAAESGDLVGPFAPSLFLALLAKDLVMLRSPLRDPFEPFVRRVAHGDDCRGA